MLHYEFLQRLRQLPSDYSYGEYRELYRDYGTHYITEATVGGIYEYTLVVNSEELQKAGVCIWRSWKSFGASSLVGKLLGGYPVMVQVWGQKKGDGGRRSQQHLQESLQEIWE